MQSFFHGKRDSTRVENDIDEVCERISNALNDSANTTIANDTMRLAFQMTKTSATSYCITILHSAQKNVPYKMVINIDYIQDAEHGTRNVKVEVMDGSDLMSLETNPIIFPPQKVNNWVYMDVECGKIARRVAWCVKYKGVDRSMTDRLTPNFIRNKNTTNDHACMMARIDNIRL